MRRRWFLCAMISLAVVSLALGTWWAIAVVGVPGNTAFSGEDGNVILKVTKKWGAWPLRFYGHFDGVCPRLSFDYQVEYYIEYRISDGSEQRLRGSGTLFRPSICPGYYSMSSNQGQLEVVVDFNDKYDKARLETYNFGPLDLVRVEELGHVPR
jgi:hypothetical protein